ncbi:hypothetical protein BG261_02950 [Floricoccus tropicus]|uniref:Uncharacterized protein n=1 Tax=Floricoccus tropicus TaxID=1859473 RepID=A0A1E8GPM0_9LACT|nr:hypothetical protein [Floricoccus tropicus]OFI49553.1 hypothetical protein BG261_02950 [Floricoccus tropicus]
MTVKLKRGWYQRGNQFRYVFYEVANILGGFLYQTRSEVVRKSSKGHCVVPGNDKWFQGAKYHGQSLKDVETPIPPAHKIIKRSEL